MSPAKNAPYLLNGKGQKFRVKEGQRHGTSCGEWARMRKSLSGPVHWHLADRCYLGLRLHVLQGNSFGISLNTTQSRLGREDLRKNLANRIGIRECSTETDSDEDCGHEIIAADVYSKGVLSKLDAQKANGAQELWMSHHLNGMWTTEKSHDRTGSIHLELFLNCKCYYLNVCLVWKKTSWFQ